MKVFFFLVPLFVTTAATAGLGAPSCQELKGIVQTYERDLNRYKFPQCNADFIKSIVPNLPQVEPGETPLDKLACQDFTVVDNVLNNALAEQAILDGIAKMRNEVQVAKQGSSPQKFIDSLGMAQSMEALVNTNIDDKPLLALLKEKISEIKNAQDLVVKVAELCPKRSSEKNACTQGVFTPTEDQAKEIITLLKNSNVSAQDINGWKNELAIKKAASQENADYSFTQMRSEMNEAFAKLDSGETLTKGHMLAIKKLENFTFNPKYSALSNAPKTNAVISEKLFVLMNDTKERQKTDVQSKVSLLYDELKNEMKDSFPLKDSSHCDSARMPDAYEAALSCMEDLSAVKDKIVDPGNLLRSKFDIMYDNLTKTKNYASTLEKTIEKCRSQMGQTKIIPDACLANFNDYRDKLKAKIEAISSIKRKMAANNEDNMKFRNFALQKWSSQKCSDVVENKNEFCAQDNPLSEDSFMTVGYALDIAIKFSKTPTAEKDAKDVCDRKEDRSEKYKKAEERLCAYFNDKTSDIVVTDNAPKPVPDGPVAAPEGNQRSEQTRDILTQGLSNIAAQLMNYYNTPQGLPYGMNPYPYNYFPTSLTTPPMGIADTIMFNARMYGGYGFYMPTPGYTPRTAFGPEVSWTSYKAVSTPKSSYFGF